MSRACAAATNLRWPLCIAHWGTADQFPEWRLTYARALPSVNGTAAVSRLNSRSAPRRCAAQYAPSVVKAQLAATRCTRQRLPVTLIVTAAAAAYSCNACRRCGVAVSASRGPRSLIFPNWLGIEHRQNHWASESTGTLNAESIVLMRLREHAAASLYGRQTCAGACWTPRLGTPARRRSTNIRLRPRQRAVNSRAVDTPRASR
jgi:hypothetical protein